MTRSDFLSNIWNSYPVPKSELDYFGRWQSISANQAYLWQQDKPILIHLPAEVILYLEQDKNLKLSSQNLLEILSDGDWIACHFLNSAEKIQLDSLMLLAPCMGKFNFESQRDEANRQKAWQVYLKAVRDFFLDQNFYEILTPTLVDCPGTEPFLEPFFTELKVGRNQKKYFLPTSPELHLKKCLSKGYEAIFEIKSCFRNGELGPHHQPEFLMLEWYRSMHHLEQIQKDVEKLVEKCQQQLRESGFDVRPLPNFNRTSMAQLFKEKLNFKLTPNTSRDELEKLAKTLKMHTTHSDSWDDLFFKIFLTFIEPEMKTAGAVFLADYPVSQAALARINEAGWADRFEFYWQGLEIANAFYELNDPKIQRQRTLADIQEKARLGLSSVPLDEGFLHALELGMPPSAGIALGLERLFMALMGYDSLAQVKLFPLKEEFYV